MHDAARMEAGREEYYYSLFAGTKRGYGAPPRAGTTRPDRCGAGAEETVVEIAAAIKDKENFVEQVAGRQPVRNLHPAHQLLQIQNGALQSRNCATNSSVLPTLFSLLEKTIARVIFYP